MKWRPKNLLLLKSFYSDLVFVNTTPFSRTLPTSQAAFVDWIGRRLWHTTCSSSVSPPHLSPQHPRLRSRHTSSGSALGRRKERRRPGARLGISAGPVKIYWMPLSHLCIIDRNITKIPSRKTWSTWTMRSNGVQRHPAWVWVGPA